MCVPNAKPAQNDFAMICLTVAIGVFQKDQLGLLSDKNATVPHFQTRGNVESLRKDRRLDRTDRRVRNI